MGRRTIILGLTGSIAMGKSTAAAMFRRMGVRVFEADRVVHGLFTDAEVVAEIAKLFPKATKGGMIDRETLGAAVFGDKAALKKLEAVLHPRVGRAELQFLKQAALRRDRLVVLEIPLLFETGGDRRCDATIVVTAPRFIQQARLLRRPAMTPERLAAIRARQMPEHEKLKRTDFIVPTGLGRALTLRHLSEIARMA
ncbi:MAG: dephospho-CoA kinase [Alphaproteobacteria bacterium]